jgi:hypothetical protein
VQVWQTASRHPRPPGQSPGATHGQAQTLSWQTVPAGQSSSAPQVPKVAVEQEHSEEKATALLHKEKAALLVDLMGSTSGLYEVSSAAHDCQRGVRLAKLWLDPTPLEALWDSLWKCSVSIIMLRADHPFVWTRRRQHMKPRGAVASDYLSVACSRGSFTTRVTSPRSTSTLALPASRSWASPGRFRRPICRRRTRPLRAVRYSFGTTPMFASIPEPV